MAVLIKSDSDPLPHPRTACSSEDGDAEEDGPTTARETGVKAAAKLRRVSFPVDEQLVTGYVEPPNPWEKAVGVTTPEVVTAYVNACNRYNLSPIPGVLQQLQMIERFDERVQCLDLHGEKLSGGHMEALEEVFKRVRFITVNLENTSLDDESSLPLFDMLEYYDSTKVLNISRNYNISMQGWQACCRMIKRTRCLEELIACAIPLEDESIRLLQRTFKINPNLAVLRLDNCGISGRLLATLMNGLKPNKVLRELHLADNQMSSSDGVQVAQLLRSNLQLRLLNLGGNQLEDQGISHLAEGLGDQNQVQVLLKLAKNRGLRSLVLRDNKLTSTSALSLSKALMENKSLESLDLGGNNINNEGVYMLKETLMRNRSLVQLKLNDCRITCEGAVALAEYVAENTKIQEVDLRDNCIRLGGLLALVQSMKVNQSVTKLELDTPSIKESPSDAEQRKQLLLQVSEYSDRNFDIQEKKRELEAAAAEDAEDVNGNDEDDDIVSEPVSKLLSLWSHPPPKRPSSVTCHPPIKVSSVAESPPDPGGWQSVRGTAHYHHYLRSPQPSPSSSPIPSPTRNRFHVTRVFQEVDSRLDATRIVQAPLLTTAKTNNESRVKFFVTPVIDIKFEEPNPNSVTSSTSSSCSPQLDEQKCDIEESSDNDSVFLDQPEISSSSSSSSTSSSNGVKVEEESDNCNGDRDSGIYLLDLSCEDLDANVVVVEVPNKEKNSSNNELIDRLLQDSSAAVCADETSTLVDVGESYLWTESSPNNSAMDSNLIGIDFLTDSGTWTSPVEVTGDLITFKEVLEPVWLSERDATSATNGSISKTNTDNCESFDGGESNGSSDSGVTDVDYVPLDETIQSAIISPLTTAESDSEPLNATCEPNVKRRPLTNSSSHKIKNGYRGGALQQVDGGNDGSKRTRTLGVCAGSKDVGNHWTL